MCTANRQPLLSRAGVSEVALAVLGNLHEVGWRTLAYCVMPDHVHVLVVTPLRSPRAFAQAFKAVVARNLRHERAEGPVWQRGYHDRVIRRLDGIAATVWYIIENPVRKGLVEHWADWGASGSLMWPNLGDLLDASRSPEDILWHQALEPKV